MPYPELAHVFVPSADANRIVCRQPLATPVCSRLKLPKRSSDCRTLATGQFTERGISEQYRVAHSLVGQLENCQGQTALDIFIAVNSRRKRPTDRIVCRCHGGYGFGTVGTVQFDHVPHHTRPSRKIRWNFNNRGRRGQWGSVQNGTAKCSKRNTFLRLAFGRLGGNPMSFYTSKTACRATRCRARHSIGKGEPSCHRCIRRTPVSEIYS